MFVMDSMGMFAVAALITAISALVWSLRRKP